LPSLHCASARNGSRKIRHRQLTTPQRSAALKLDWTKIGTQLGLKGNTAAALQSFKKRNDDARRKVTVLSEQAQTIDFQHYRSILKNQAIVDDIEKQFNAFKPQTYDVSRQIKAIEAFEAQALQSAEETKTVVDKELSDLEKTLKNIEDARPFADLTVVRIPWMKGRRQWMLMVMAGRGCSCAARHRQAHRAACVEGPLGCSGLQGESLQSVSGLHVDPGVLANTHTGEVWRSVRPISTFLRLAKTCPVWVVSPYLVNSARNAILDFHVHCHFALKIQSYRLFSSSSSLPTSVSHFIARTIGQSLVDEKDQARLQGAMASNRHVHQQGYQPYCGIVGET